MKTVGLDDMPSHVIFKVISFIGEPKDIATISRVNRQWLSTARSKSLWTHLKLEGQSRLTLQHLTQFVNSPWSSNIISLSIEGFVVRSPPYGSPKTVSDRLMTLMVKKMPKLVSLRLYNANISNLDIKTIPKRIERVSLEGCMVDPSSFEELSKRNVLPNLKHLDLNYVGGVNSFSGNFEAVLRKTELQTLLLRHCHKISTTDFIRIGKSLPNLRILNISEVADIGDSVLEALADHKKLVELYVAFTIITDKGISHLCENKKSSLRLLDIRGCPKVTSNSLLNLHDCLRLDQVWISQKMKGASVLREQLTKFRMKILDEVDLKKTAIAQDLSRYSAHFGDAMKENEDDEDVDEADPVEDPNFAVPFGYFG